MTEGSKSMEKILDGYIHKLDTRQADQVASAAKSIQKLVVRLCDEGGSGTLRKKKGHSSKDLDEFLALQDSFSYNIAGRLTLQIESAVLNVSADETPQVEGAIAILQVLQGLCLVHRASRLVFNNDRILNSLIQAVRHTVPEIQTAAINTLVAVMVRQVENIRRFEALGGLKIITDIFKHRLTTKQVKLTILEFLFFYLVPETKYADIERTVPRKTTAAKQQMLGRYLSNVDGLVRELEVNQPFGAMDLEW